MKETKVIERRIVLVEWEDILATDTNWRDENDAQDWVDESESIVRQVGFLLSKDENYISLLCSYLPETAVGSVTRIPMTVVKYIKELTFDEFKR
jgi:hypothetical protein